MSKRRSKNSKQETYKAIVVAVILALVITVDKLVMPKLQSTNTATDEKTTVTDGSSLTVDFIDVGQGDSTLVECDGEFMLVDTGDRDGDDSVIAFLKQQGVEKLEYLILSHPDADHIGEAADIIEAFEIETVITPELPDDLIPTTKTYENLLDAMDDKGLKFHAAADEEFTLGGCTVKTYAVHEEYSSTNDYSVITKIIHGENSFLLPGDCEEDEEQEMLESGIDLSADVLKAAHHGSNTSSTQEWLDAVNPEYAVISCGVDNRYGHPHEETLERLQNAADTVYITAEVGTIEFTSDGESLTAETIDEEE